MKSGLKSWEKRWEYDDPCLQDDFETFRRLIKGKHSVFARRSGGGHHLVQEYGRYFGCQSGCPAGGCLPARIIAALNFTEFLII